jgi:hypothetical protein
MSANEEARLLAKEFCDAIGCTRAHHLRNELPGFVARIRAAVRAPLEARIAELEEAAVSGAGHHSGGETGATVTCQRCIALMRAARADLESQLAESRRANLDAQQQRIAAEERVKELEANRRALEVIVRDLREEVLVDGEDAAAVTRVRDRALREAANACDPGETGLDGRAYARRILALIDAPEVKP